MYKKYNYNNLYKYKILKYINFYDYKLAQTYNEHILIKKNIKYLWISCSKLAIGYKIRDYLNNIVIFPILTIDSIKNKRILNNHIIKKSLKLNIKKILFNVSNISNDIIKLIISFLFIPLKFKNGTNF
jgi:hypothetical protein